MSEFFQTAPDLKNQFTSDSLLQNYLHWRLGASLSLELWPDLERLGGRVVGDLFTCDRESEENPPKHIPYDAWGRRIDKIEIHPAWETIAKAAAEEGIVAIGYERKYGELSRSYQFAKLYLYHASSAFFSCPLAMTDGAARALELFGDQDLKNGAFRHLTSRDPQEFWISGQWMTERTGGSDVSGTSTIAKALGGDQYSLHGTKWFTSATTSQMAMTLARIEGAAEGSRGLSLFYLELRDPKTNLLNNIEVHRLKDKLGTKSLPTAELSMHGTPAKLVGGEGGGVKKIASLFNITRMYNAVCALSATRRALALAGEYSQVRKAFGKKIADHPLHAETLADLHVEFSGNFLLTFQLIHLLGKEETGKASSEESAILRLLTPIAKLYTAKSCVAITSEVLEVFGGAGYVEDTGIPRLLRDAQVFSIWEGTTNVLSLDVLRAIEKENAFSPFMRDMHERLAKVKRADLQESVARAFEACSRISDYVKRAMSEGPDFMNAGARAFAFSLARTYSATLLLEFAESQKDLKYGVIAMRWCAKDLTPLLNANAEHLQQSRLLFS